MKLDLFKIEDYEEVYSLWLSVPGMGLNTVDDSKYGIEKYLNRNPNSCFVARDAGKIVGVTLCGHDGRRGNIHHTAVAKDYIRKGIGRQLVEKSISALRKEGIHKIAFVVFKQNKTGNEFWENLGFQSRDDLIYRDKIISDTEIIRIDT